MSAKRDYYEVLGVTKTSSSDEIKNQYRKLALKFHPDRNQSKDASEHFKEISEAYAVLSDSEKKQTYDQHGHEGVDGDIVMMISLVAAVEVAVLMIFLNHFWSRRWQVAVLLNNNVDLIFFTKQQ